MPNQTPTVFISHAGLDTDCALELQKALCTVGINAHLDQVELRLGDNVIKWMNDAASESDYMLVLVSQNSIGRYWVETEWSAALAREADLRRTFVIPVILPGVDDKSIPFLLRAKIYLDMRNDREAAVIQLINQLKQDQQIARDRGRFPSPAPMEAQEDVIHDFRENQDWLKVIVCSNRFARTFRFDLPANVTPTYILALLQSKLNLKWNNIDSDLMVELSYTYSIVFNGKRLPLDTPIRESGVENGSKLELWIQVTLTDLLEKQTKNQNASIVLQEATMTESKIARYLTHALIIRNRFAEETKHEAAVEAGAERIMKLLMVNRDFTGAQIALIAERYFAHVDA